MARTVRVFFGLAVLVVVVSACQGDQSVSTSSLAEQDPDPSTTLVLEPPTSASTENETGTSQAARFELATDMTEALDLVGMGCVDVTNRALDEPPPGLEGPTSSLGCEWPPGGSVPADHILAAVFDSEMSRLRLLTLWLIVVGCFDTDPPPASLSYAYGATWFLLSETGANGIDVFADVALVLDGSANTADCRVMLEWDDSFQSGVEAEQAFLDLTESELAALLGERPGF